MFKKLCFIFLFIYPLTGCDPIIDKLKEKVDSQYLETSDAQNNKAHLLFLAVKAKDRANFLALVEPMVREDLYKSPNIFLDMTRYIPEGDFAAPEIMNIEKREHQKYGKLTEVIYRYAFEQNNIVLNVIFSGHDGTDRVIGFYIHSVAVQQK